MKSYKLAVSEMELPFVELCSCASSINFQREVENASDFTSDIRLPAESKIFCLEFHL